ncbi:MAG: xylose isomerase [Myxococcota bacterium]
MEYFPSVPEVPYGGPRSDTPLSFRHYNPKETILKRTMEDHLRMSVCFWHTLCWNGRDIFGEDTFARPWLVRSDMEGQKAKVDAGFELVRKLGVPFYSFHDVDVIPATDSPKEYESYMAEMTEHLGRRMEEGGVRLLWGTANLFGHRRYLHGAATSPDPEIFAWAAHQVRHAMKATQALGGENYVLWGGREGYETLLNTDLRQERRQLGRFMRLVVDHKYALGFDGTLLIEPKPHEPTKHQYDYDVAAVHSFLSEFGLLGEMKVNLEVNHATLAGHSFHHEVASALALDIFGSVDANRGDPQLGWDTDQFPAQTDEMTLALYEILNHGGFSSGGFNFDARLRRASTDPIDLFSAHIMGIDTLALALRRAVALIEESTLSSFVANRYRGWSSDFGRHALGGDCSLADLSKQVVESDLRPEPESGGQEHLELAVHRTIYR